jgi:lysophospholipase L1-like esterase
VLALTACLILLLAAADQEKGAPARRHGEKLTPTMFRVISALLLALTCPVWGDPSFVVWPMPPKPEGLSDAEYPAPREYGYFRNFQDEVDKARSGPVDLIFDGDSVQNAWHQRAENIWLKYYGALNAVAFGAENDQINNILWRMDHGELDGLHPKLIVLEAGSTNLFGKPEDVATGIKALVDACRQHCPDSHILLMGIFPVGPSPTDPARMMVNQVNPLISKLDDGRNVTYLDIGGKFLQPDGTLNADLAPTPTFKVLSEKGYQAWADAIHPIIDRYCPKSAASPPGAPVPPISSDEPKLTWPYPMIPAVGETYLTHAEPPLGWVSGIAQRLNDLKPGSYDLVFDGDSITQNWLGPGKEVWQQRYGSLKAGNLGVGGDVVQNALWRVQHGELEGQNPKLIELLIGTNNHGEDPKEVAAGIKLMLHEYETRCPHAHILLLGIFPVGSAPHTPQRDWVAQVNQIISAYGSDSRVTYMDIGDKFLQPDGTLTADIMPDFLHPSAKGYVIWADAIQPVIDKYFKVTAK